MKNYFKIHKLTDDRKEMSRDFITHSHIDAGFVESVSQHDNAVNSMSIVHLLGQMKELSRYAIFLASSEDHTKTRPLSWEEIEEKVSNKLSLLMEQGKVNLCNKIHELQTQLGDIEYQYNQQDKTTLLFKLVLEVELQAKFLKIHKQLAELQQQFSYKHFHRHVDNFYDNRVYHYVSADEFEL